jgi:hypothetical protein
MTLALKEWHVAGEAIARGDQVVTLRKGGIREKAFAVPGTAFWLFPTWEHQRATELKRAWKGELARSNRERRTDGRIPIRCHCELTAAWELRDLDLLEGLDRWHPWTTEYAASRLAWRPGKPLTVLLLRAAALLEPFPIAPSDAYDGCRSWVELEVEPEGRLIPSLTDAAFERRATLIRELLGAPAAELAAAR